LAPQDKKAIQLWVEEQTDEDRRKLKEWYDSLKELRNGEAWVWHPEKPTTYRKIMFRERETFHATRTFLLSPKAATIKLMDVQEFIEKFRNVFEPKPRVEQKPQHSPTVKTGKETPAITPEAHHVSGNRGPVIPDVETTVVRQMVPNVVLEKLKPTIQLPADLTEPPTPLARVLVILTNHDGRDDRWTGSKIKKLIRDHAWQDDGADEAIDELTRWEILRRQSNNYLRFYRERVQVAEQPYD